MNLAIFFDAAAVAGDESLLAAARAHLDALLAGQDQYLARFAAAADQFHEPGNFWTRLTSGRKGATRPRWT
jgi:CBS domain-containing protein